MTAAAIRPVLDAESAATAVAILVANPGSLVASRGPQWVLQDSARRLVADAAIALLVGDDAGVILADRMQTPGHLRLSLAAADDAAIAGETLDVALREAITFLAASVDLVRVDLVFGVYNELLVGWALGADGVRFEGVLSDAFFAGGRYWDGLIVAFTGAALESFRDRSVPAREKRIADRLRARIRTDLEPEPVEAIA